MEYYLYNKLNNWFYYSQKRDITNHSSMLLKQWILRQKGYLNLNYCLANKSCIDTWKWNYYYRHILLNMERNRCLEYQKKYKRYCPFSLEQWRSEEHTSELQSLR